MEFRMQLHVFASPAPTEIGQEVPEPRARIEARVHQVDLVHPRVLRVCHVEHSVYGPFTVVSDPLECLVVVAIPAPERATPKRLKE